MIKTAVYDFFGSNKYYYYESDEDGYSLKNQLTFDSILINKPINSNLKPYLIDHNNPSTEDFKKSDFKINDANNYSPNYSISTENSHYPKNNICYRWNIFNALINYDKLSKSSKDNLSDDLDNYLKYQKGIIEEKFHNNESKIIIPVHDNLAIEAQELLLAKFKDRDKTILLWKSVAAYLGAREKALNYNLQDNDEIIIIDRQKNKFIYTWLTMVKEKNKKHLIPSHKSYLDPFEKLNKQYFKETYIYSDKNKITSYVEAIHYPNIGKFPFIKTSGEWDIKDIKKIDDSINLNHLHVEADSKVKLVLMIGENIKINPFFVKTNILHLSQSIIAEGAYVFTQIKNEGKIPYYDHCDGLHMVYQKDSEGSNTLEYSTLIKENDRAEGGKMIEAIANNDLSIGKNENFVKFLLRIGTKDRDGRLRELRQVFEIASLKHKCPISLKSYMTPGQGRTKVIITCEKYGEMYGIEEKPFEEVLLDWKQLKDSDETVNILENKLPKAFPPPISSVKTRYANKNKYLSSKQQDIKYQITDYIYGSHTFGLKINDTKWPNIHKDSIERFQRTNIFGNEENYRNPYLGPDTDILVDKFFTKLAKKCFPLDDKDFIDDHILLIIAWSYQGRSQGYFNSIIDFVLQDMQSLSLCQTKASLLVNLLEDDKDSNDLINVFKTCLTKFNKHSKGFNTWLRCLYQLLMYHEFVSSTKISNNECIGMMDKLIDIYNIAVEEHKTLNSNYALRSMLFLLKRRQIFPQFCKKDSNDGLYNRIINLQAINRKDEALLKTLIGFLDGSGSLIGIPLN